MNELDVRQSTDIQSFNPEKTATEIAQLEGIEKMYKKAKDADNLCLAIESKMERQRDFVVWWDQQEKGQGERTDLQHSNGSVTKLSDYNIDKMTVSRWRKWSTDEEKYDHKLSDAIEKAIRACEGKGSPFAELHGNKNNDWYTPKQYIDAARKVMGSIDIDPASSDKAQETVRAKQYYTAETNGLEKDWVGNVWINPPFSGVFPFAEKLISHLESGEVSQAIVLTNNNTDTLWWHKMAELASCVCFTRGRISFYDCYGETSAPTNGQTFFYFGDNKQGFVDEFYGHGLILS